MDNQAKNGKLSGISQESLELAKCTLGEWQNGKDVTVCPKCKQTATVSFTEHGERTIISCECKYIFMVEINL